MNVGISNVYQLINLHWSQKFSADLSYVFGQPSTLFPINCFLLKNTSIGWIFITYFSPECRLLVQYLVLLFLTTWVDK